MTHVLIVTRKGVAMYCFVGELEELKTQAQALDGVASIRWQDFGWEVGAGSEWDDERSYHIYPARTTTPVTIVASSSP